MKTQLKLPFDKYMSPKVKLILELMDEKNEAGKPKYQDAEIARQVGFTRQYISHIRGKYERPPAWDVSSRKVENRIENFDPAALHGLTIEEIAEKCHITYAQAQGIAKRHRIKTRRKDYCSRPATSKLPSQEALKKEHDEGVSWQKLADKYKVSIMTIHRHMGKV